MLVPKDSAYTEGEPSVPPSEQPGLSLSSATLVGRDIGGHGGESMAPPFQGFADDSRQNIYADDPIFLGLGFGSYLGDSSFVGRDPASYEGPAAAALQAVPPTHPETSSLENRSFFQALAFPITVPDGPFGVLNMFAGRICLLLFESPDMHRRDLLVSAETETNIRIAGFVLDREEGVHGPMREATMDNFKLGIKKMLKAFHLWHLTWATAVTDVSNEASARDLTLEASLHNPVGWVKALLLVFGHLPELWAEQPETPPGDSEVVPPNPSASALREKGKAVDRSNLQSSALQHEQVVQQQYAASFASVPGHISNTNSTNSLQHGHAISTAPGAFASQPHPVTGYYPSPGGYPPHVSVDPRSQFMSNGAYPPSGSAAPVYGAPTFMAPSSSNAYAPAMTAGSPQPNQPRTNLRPSPIPPTMHVPHQASFNGHPGTATGGVSHPLVDINPYDLSRLAGELGGISLPRSAISQDAAFREAAACLRWSNSTQSLGSARMSMRSLVRRELKTTREKWEDLVEQYKKIKETQIAKLDEAVRTLRQWHALLMELNYRLVCQGMQIPTECQAVTNSVFSFIQLITLLIVYRRQQLQNLP